MLKPILIQAANDTPEIELDSEKGVFRFEGKSLPEDVIKFFAPVQNWFDQYAQNPNPQTKIVFNLDYFNSSSARFIVKILIGLENINGIKSDVNVLWYYLENDEVMHDRGMELKSVLKLPFNLVERKTAK